MTVDLDRRPMLVALLGAVSISFSPVLYVFSDTNPSTGAFFSVDWLFLAPVLLYFSLVLQIAKGKSGLI